MNITVKEWLSLSQQERFISLVKATQKAITKE